MSHVSSTPAPEVEGTSGKKRSITVLSPEASLAKRRKPMELASGYGLDAVTVNITHNLDKPLEPTVSSTPMDPHPEVWLDLPASVSMHEMILKDASANELLRLLGKFLLRRCCLLKDLLPDDPGMWLHTVDLFLLLCRFQEKCFIVPGSVVFLYMLCRDIVPAEVSSIKELQILVLTCSFEAYSYIGHETGYPAMPFIVEESSSAFWQRTIDITKRTSDKMLRMNYDPQFFAEVFADLKSGTGH